MGWTDTLAHYQALVRQTRALGRYQVTVLVSDLEYMLAELGELERMRASLTKLLADAAAEAVESSRKESR